eukprot:ANDGO_06091.mRNA.1 hypothetical protein
MMGWQNEQEGRVLLRRVPLRSALTCMWRDSDATQHVVCVPSLPEALAQDGFLARELFFEGHMGIPGHHDFWKQSVYLSGHYVIDLLVEVAELRIFGPDAAANESRAVLTDRRRILRQIISVSVEDAQQNAQTGMQLFA